MNAKRNPLVAVCMKRVPDASIRMDLKEDGTGVDSYDLVFEINPNDRVCLREALRLGKRLDATVAAVSFGPPACIGMLRTAMAIGADRALMVEGDEEAGMRREAVLRGLSSAVESLGSPLIFCGDESTSEMRGEMGARLAARLGCLYVHSVMEVENVDTAGGRAILRRFVGNGKAQRIEVQLPAVFSFVPWAGSSLGDRDCGHEHSRAVESLRKEVERVKPDGEAPADRNSCGRTSLVLAGRRREDLHPPGPELPASSRMASLFPSAEMGRSGNMLLEGPPEETAKALLEELYRRMLI